MAVMVDSLSVTVCRVPTDAPESDGTLCWEATTAVIVRLAGGGAEGIGWTYSHAAAGGVIAETLRPLVEGNDAFAVEAAAIRMGQAIRNLGRPGIGMCAVSAVDMALWDLKARLLGVAVADLLGMVRDAVPVYGSGGFTSYSMAHLTEQAAHWADAGIRMVKMKVGTRPADDLPRVRQVRDAVGEGTEIFVDANGAYSRKQALAMAERFAREGVAWFEEPVSSDDLEGLRLLRDHGPPGLEVAAGEYGHDASYFCRMLAAGAVDVLQADATRCGGYTGYLKAEALAQAFHVPLSAHTAPALHVHVCCAGPATRHLEYFHDHARLESMLFDGVPSPRDGRLAPDRSRPGNGLTLRESEAAKFAA
ncbi:MAG: enolase C-terminal domain-like protein [Pseudomonadota bacterium]